MQLCQLVERLGNGPGGGGGGGRECRRRSVRLLGDERFGHGLDAVGDGGSVDGRLLVLQLQQQEHRVPNREVTERDARELVSSRGPTLGCKDDGDVARVVLRLEQMHAQDGTAGRKEAAYLLLGQLHT